MAEQLDVHREKEASRSLLRRARPANADSSGNPDTGAPAKLTVVRLQELEWKRFELIVARYFGATGMRAVGAGVGPDGGVDVRLFRGDDPQPFAYVQCKAWKRWVGPKPLRELVGVMASENIEIGYFLITGSFTPEARNCSAATKLCLIDGDEFVRRFSELPEAARAEILAESFAGDYRTPSCPSCGTKLVQREGAAGGRRFWGCANYPRCTYTLNQKTLDEGRANEA